MANMLLIVLRKGSPPRQMLLSFGMVFKKFTKCLIRALHPRRRKELYIWLLIIAAVAVMTPLPPYASNPQSWRVKHHPVYERETYVHTFTNKRSNLSRNMTVLFWTPVLPDDPTWGFVDPAGVFASCPVNNCIMTTNRNHTAETDAMFFHAKHLPEIPPDFKYRRQDQVYIYFSLESMYNVLPNLTRYNSFFNWTLTYRRRSDISSPYGRFEALPRSEKRLWSQRMRHKERRSSQYTDSSSASILWVVSNCWDYAYRILIVKQLQRHIRIDIFGRCSMDSLRNSVWKHGQYKFYLALENTYCEDYITEKFWDALQRDQIPIVVGNADYKHLAPPNSYIDILDFESFEHLAAYIRFIDNHDEAFNNFFKWRDHWRIRPLALYCDLCAALHKPHVHQVYTDIETYMVDELCPRQKDSPWGDRLRKLYFRGNTNHMIYKTLHNIAKWRDSIYFWQM